MPNARVWLDDRVSAVDRSAGLDQFAGFMNELRLCSRCSRHDDQRQRLTAAATERLRQISVVSWRLLAAGPRRTACQNTYTAG